LPLYIKLLLLVLLLAVAVYSSWVDAGRVREFVNQKNIYLTEWSKLKHQAELGDPEALFTLGNFYFEPPRETVFSGQSTKKPVRSI